MNKSEHFENIKGFYLQNIPGQRRSAVALILLDTAVSSAHSFINEFGARVSTLRYKPESF